MKKALYLPILTLLSLLLACANYFEALNEKSIVLFSVHSADKIPFAAPSITVNIACDNVFGTQAVGDWMQSSKTIITTVSLPQGKACRLTVTGFFDGTNTYSSVSSMLVITISQTGSVATTGSYQYVNGSGVNQWLLATQGPSLYTVNLGYAAQNLTATTSVTPSVLSLQNMSDTLAQVVAPTVANLTLTETRVLLITYDTLTANVTSSTGCKYIDNSGASPTYNAASWSSVNTAYNNASAANCPIMVPGSPLLILGNWTLLWKTNIKTLVIWANTLNGVTAYTTAMVGP